MSNPLLSGAHLRPQRLMTLTFLILSIVMLLEWRLSERLERAQSDLERLSQARGAPAVSPKDRLTFDFASDRHGQQVSSQEFISRSQQRARRLNIYLSGVSVSRHVATPTAVDRAETSITAVGTYGPLKQMLAESLDRHPAVLQTLSIQRSGTPNYLEMQATFHLLHPPPPASGLASE